MPIYNLGKKEPQLPSEGSYWVAPNAVSYTHLTLPTTPYV